MRLITTPLFALLLLITPLASHSEETKTLPEGIIGVWSGEVEAGGSKTTGNTDEEKVKGRINVKNESQKWIHELLLDGRTSSTDDVRTEQVWFIQQKTRYRFTTKDYVFETIRYEDDRFGGFDYQASFAAGYGRRVIESPTMLLDLELGPGYRREEAVDGTTSDDFIGRFGLSYAWQLSEHAEFAEELLVEAGSDNTFTRSETSLRTDIVGNLGLKLSYILKHNSDVPPATKNTDTETVLSLVYAF